MAESEYTALARKVRRNLKEIVFNLEMTHAGLVVAAGHLKFQNAERDPEVAHVLEHFIASRLYDQIERTERFLASLPSDSANDGGDVEVAT